MEELFEQIIYQAIKKNVSDIHLQCTEKGVIKFRICGELLKLYFLLFKTYT